MQSFLNLIPNVYLEVAIADDKNNPDKAKYLAEKLTKGFIKDINGERRPILAVLGNYTSESTGAALPTYSSAKLPIISPLSTVTEFRNKFEDNNKVFFRTATSSKFEAAALATEVEEYKKRSKKNNPRIIAFYKQDKKAKDPNFSKKFSQDLFNKFVESLKDKDISVSKTFYLNDDEPFENLIVEIKDADIIVLFPDGRNAGGDTSSKSDQSFMNAIKVLDSAKDLKKDYLILGSNPLLTSLNPNDKQVNSLMMHHSNKLVIAVDWSEDYPKPEDNSNKQKFISQYQSLWGGSLNRTTALSYEAAQVLSELIKKGKITQQEIIGELNNGEFKVKSDVFDDKYISFNKDGDRVGIDQRILVTPDSKSGKFVHYNPTLP